MCLKAERRPENGKGARVAGSLTGKKGWLGTRLRQKLNTQ